LSLVEDRRPRSAPDIIELLQALRRDLHGNAAQRIGFTGPPGVGKSSLVASFARELRKRDATVGILAVDPSSPRSGGALLGDRARIDPDPEDDHIFVRSMASGGDLGGLARAAFSAVEVLSAAYDVVLIETVGVGQSETDIEFVADGTVMVLQPASGDILQFLKAGILEVPDAFAVNKSDLGEVAQRTMRDLQSSLDSARKAGLAFDDPIAVATSALDGTGVSDLADAVESLHGRLKQSGRLERRRQRGGGAWAERALLRRVGEVGVAALGGPHQVRELIAERSVRGDLGLAIVADLEPEAIRCIVAGHR